MQRSCKTNLLGGAEMKKGGAIYDQIMPTEPSRKMPPPFYGPQQNNLQETIYYQHGFPLVSTKFIMRNLSGLEFQVGYQFAFWRMEFIFWKNIGNLSGRSILGREMQNESAFGEFVTTIVFHTLWIYIFPVLYFTQIDCWRQNA